MFFPFRLLLFREPWPHLLDSTPYITRRGHCAPRDTRVERGPLLCAALRGIVQSELFRPGDRDLTQDDDRPRYYATYRRHSLAYLRVPCALRPSIDVFAARFAASAIQNNKTTTKTSMSD